MDEFQKRLKDRDEYDVRDRQRREAVRRHEDWLERRREHEDRLAYDDGGVSPPRSEEDYREPSAREMLVERVSDFNPERPFANRRRSSRDRSPDRDMVRRGSSRDQSLERDRLRDRRSADEVDRTERGRRARTRDTDKLEFTVKQGPLYIGPKLKEDGMKYLVEEVRYFLRHSTGKKPEAMVIVIGSPAKNAYSTIHKGLRNALRNNKDVVEGYPDKNERDSEAWKKFRLSDAESPRRTIKVVVTNAFKPLLRHEVKKIIGVGVPWVGYQGSEELMRAWIDFLREQDRLSASNMCQTEVDIWIDSLHKPQVSVKCNLTVSMLKCLIVGWHSRLVPSIRWKGRVDFARVARGVRRRSGGLPQRPHSPGGL